MATCRSAGGGALFRMQGLAASTPSLPPSPPPAHARACSSEARQLVTNLLTRQVGALWSAAWSLVEAHAGVRPLPAQRQAATAHIYTAPHSQAVKRLMQYLSELNGGMHCFLAQYLAANPITPATGAPPPHLHVFPQCCQPALCRGRRPASQCPAPTSSPATGSGASCMAANCWAPPPPCCRADGDAWLAELAAAPMAMVRDTRRSPHVVSIASLAIATMGEQEVSPR